MFFKFFKLFAEAQGIFAPFFRKKGAKTTAPTKKEAEYRAAEYVLDRPSDSYEALTLRESNDNYISSKSTVLSPSTIDRYERYKKLYFSKLMPMKLSKITSQLIQVAINELSANHSSKTVRNTHGLLHSVIKTYYPKIDIETILNRTDIK